MNEHNLDDLIIDTISPKNSKTKSFLTIIALAIVMLIIAIILTKIVLKSPEAEVLNMDENTVYISPELTLQTDEEEEVVKAPLIPTTEKIKPEVKVAQEETLHKEKADPTEVETVKITNEFAEAEVKRTEEAEKEALRIAQAKKEKLITEKIALDKAALDKKMQKEAAAKRAQEEAIKAVDNESITHPYFIQVGSFTKTPSQRFLDVIKNSGFNYQITVPSSNGTKKLLIGPYATKPAVDSALIRVKDRINKSAYIIKK